MKNLFKLFSIILMLIAFEIVEGQSLSPPGDLIEIQSYSDDFEISQAEAATQTAQLFTLPIEEGIPKTRYLRKSNEVAIIYNESKLEYINSLKRHLPPPLLKTKSVVSLWKPRFTNTSWHKSFRIKA